MRCLRSSDRTGPASRPPSLRCSAWFDRRKAASRFSAATLASPWPKAGSAPCSNPAQASAFPPASASTRPSAWSGGCIPGRRRVTRSSSVQISVRSSADGPIASRAARPSGSASPIAIAGDPEVVFLDEPTSAMDVESRQGFWRMMRDFGNEGRTVLFATHHLAEADEIADRVVVLNHGKVVADGPGATLKAAVATRRLRFVTDLPDRVELSELDGVTEVNVCGTGVSIDSLDADATIRDLVGRGVPFRDLEITGAGLEQAFVALTGCGSGVPMPQTSRDRPRPPTPWIEATGDRPLDRSAQPFGSPERRCPADPAPHDDLAQPPDATPGLRPIRGGTPVAELEVPRHHRRFPGDLLHPLPRRPHGGKGGRRHSAMARLPHGLDVLLRGAGGRPQRRRHPTVDGTSLRMGPPADGSPRFRPGRTSPPRSSPACSWCSR